MPTATTMKRERITHKSKDEWLAARTQDITSTEISCLFDGNPYKTRFELWHQKKLGDVVSIPDTDRMKWGRRLEDAIARGIAEDEGWDVRAWNTYERIPELRLGSSFDFRILNNPKAVLEIKCIDGWVYKLAWLDDGGELEAPPHMEFQLQHEMLVSGYDRAFLYALVGGNEIIKIEREANPVMQERIIEEAQRFWDSIAAGEEPTPDYTRDGGNIRRKYSTTNPDTTLNAAGDDRFAQLCRADIEMSATAKAAKDTRDACRAEILDIIGHNEYAVTDGYRVSAKLTKAGRRSLLIKEN